MRSILRLGAFLICVCGALAAAPDLKSPTSLFDGKTLGDWEGDPKLWRVEDGALTGGDGQTMVRRNEFLATRRDYTNFLIRFKIKLTGTEGFINSGFQIRSQRVPNSGEMKGYQCDFGEPNWYGAIYDEERRNKVMSPSDMKALRPVLRTNDWNDYVIRAEGRRVTTWINGVQGTDYIEQDPAIPDFGKLGIQIHGGGKSKVQVKDIAIEELPAPKKFEGAPDPPKAQKSSPLSPDEERASFTLPPGFEIELVVSESPRYCKFVTVAFDTQGRMWSMTALEYPVDANENPAAAQALYASLAKDKIVVFDQPFGKGPHQPRVFAEGLAIPLGVLPYKDGVYVQHGPNIEFLRDTNNDGKADKTEIILSGFGVQDSHLFPHQFTRAPGNWIWFAQGAFNYGKVKTTAGAEQQFDQTRMAKFRYDGSDFDITSQGPCNIWGLVLKANGEAFIQEANDYGYPMMPFHEYANYPGCSDAQMKSYAPIFPGTAPDFQMGGTGLSGLALSDRTAWPAPYGDIFFIANPITRKIQSIRKHEDGRLEKQPDFILSSDEMFRPVAITVGPDGCLYVVDWYNKIISHNEVPRTHPERDKTRGRIWRVKHKDQKPFEVPDFTKLNETQLIAKLSDPSLAQIHFAWQAITDRALTNLAPRLRELAIAGNIPALWSLEGLHAADRRTLQKMTTHADANVRREAIRAIGESLKPDDALSLLNIVSRADESDPQVRGQIIRAAGLFSAGVEICARFAVAPLSEPTAPSTHNGKPIKVGKAYEAEFQRYLVRLMLERHRPQTLAFVEAAIAESGKSGNLRNRPEITERLLLASLALEPKESASKVASLLPLVPRTPTDEEVLRLAQFPGEPNVTGALQGILNSTEALQALIRIRNKLDPKAIAPALTEVAKKLWTDATRRALAIQLVTAFRLDSFESELVSTLKNESTPTNQIAILKALREVGTSQDELLANLATAAKDRALRHESILTLAGSKSDRTAALIARLWPEMNALQRRLALDRLSSTKTSSAALIKEAKVGSIPKADLDTATLEKLRTAFPDEPLLTELTARLPSVLRLDGADESWMRADVSLSGAFTVEAWVKLAPGIDNNDSILGAPGALDLNFYDSRFRVWAGPAGDVVVAKKRMVPNVWTHLAVTRDAAKRFAIYINGELDATGDKPAAEKFENLQVGRSNPPRGTDGWISDFRAWNTARTPSEIRENFDRHFDAAPDGLVVNLVQWPRESFHGGARVEKVDDLPQLLSTQESNAQAAKLKKYHALAQRESDWVRGRTFFSQICSTCHTVGGQGGQIGPVLNGAGANGLDTLLRAVLTPNAAMEAGYRTFRVELKSGDTLDGFLVSQNDDAIVLRQPNAQDRRIPQDEVRRASFTKMSLMPEGLLEGMEEKDATDLLAYLQTLK